MFEDIGKSIAYAATMLALSSLVVGVLFGFGVAWYIKPSPEDAAKLLQRQQVIEQLSPEQRHVLGL